MNRRQIKKILDCYGFELPMGMLDSILSPLELKQLAEWVRKHKMNLYDFTRLSLEYGSYIVCPCELPHDDPRYDADDAVGYVADGAPSEAERLFKAMRDSGDFWGKLPYIHFRM